MFAAFNTIVVALDGRQGGLDAAALAGLLATREADVVVARVLASASDAAPLAAAGRVDEMTREATRLLAGDRARPSGVEPPVLTVRSRSVSAGLRELVVARGADLLVVGAHHHGHLHLRSRDHTRDALRQMPCAVGVAPSGYSHRPAQVIRAVGVGYVDDRTGRVVLDTARAVAWQLGAEVHATTIVAPSNWPAADSGVGWRAAAAARRMTQIPGVHGTAVEGEPHRELAALSDEVDLLVIGTHHRGVLRRLLPDVAEDLSHTSRCPLLVLPHVAARR